MVLTGAKRERGITKALAPWAQATLRSPPARVPSKHWMAAPMAVSSCNTLVDALSLGSTVFEFLSKGFKSIKGGALHHGQRQRTVVPLELALQG